MESSHIKPYEVQNGTLAILLKKLRDSLGGAAFYTDCFNQFYQKDGAFANATPATKRSGGSAGILKLMALRWKEKQSETNTK